MTSSNRQLLVALVLQLQPALADWLSYFDWLVSVALVRMAHNHETQLSL
ncbi:hypothetical protein [Rheinheimera mangrovi]|nr:hypothetical protein [Rheinheimera mangrovi]